MVFATVTASMKNEVRRVKLEIDGDTIKEADCTCAIGQGKRCRHIAIVLIHITKTTSSTSLPCEWLKKKPLPGEIKTVREAFQKQNVSRTLKILKGASPLAVKEKCLTLLKENELSLPVGWLLQVEPPTPSQEFSELFMEEIFKKQEFQESANHESFLKDYFGKELTMEKTKTITIKTIGQWENNLYSCLHKCRITGSNFGAVLKAIKRNRFSKSLFQRLTNVYNLDKVKSVKYGRDSEGTAFEYCKRFIPEEIRRAGFYLHSSGVIGCSPDGIGDQFILEIKCPYKWREKHLDNSILTAKENYVIFYSDSHLVINQRHDYYDQIQAQIHICKKEYGLLCIWTKVDSILVKIEKDQEWEENLIKLQDFFYKTYLPYILNLRNTRNSVCPSV